MHIIKSQNWPKIRKEIHNKGFTIVPNILTSQQCSDLIDDYSTTDLYRKTVVMERYRFGRGEYKYFDYPLPNLVEALRISIYPKLAPIANKWFNALRIDKIFPANHAELIQQCRDNNQTKATPLILKYKSGGYNTLHQDLYGDIYFPLQCALFLNEPNLDYKGGEFVMTQQTPRAQSKAIVLTPTKGDLLIFSTNFRPVKGTRGYYRVKMKHGVSEVHNGERHTLGIIFHDAQT